MKDIQIRAARDLSHRMADLAAVHPNNEISNALSRVAHKLESYGLPFGAKLTELDKKIIAYYHTTTK